MDGLRKVPSNVPNREMVGQYLGCPLTSVPDPFGEKESYGHYMNAKLRSFLDAFDFEYEFYSATQCYKEGIFNHMMIRVMEKYDQIMDLMLPTFGEERKATYSPFMPVCERTGRVLQVPISKVDRDSASVEYADPDTGELMSVSVLNGCCKLQWKPDFGMRWAALEVNYEMYGKDHLPNAPIYSRICEILDGTAPVQYFFELFLNEEGQKISKSKGNSITIDEWLRYAPIESLALFMYQSPSKAKKLYFDVIPKNVDEYLTFLEKYHATDDVVKKLSNPVHHIHNGDVPHINTYGLSFGMLLNLACACNPESDDVIWGFIAKYAPNYHNDAYLSKMVTCAVRYYNDFIKANKVYAIPSSEQIDMLDRLSSELDKMNANMHELSAEEIQNVIYDIGNEFSKDNLREFFKTLYKLLLGQNDGPRLGSFIKLFGIQNFQKLIVDAQNRKLQ
jgi:lysyl-tRNA synthetase class 1